MFLKWWYGKKEIFVLILFHSGQHIVDGGHVECLWIGKYFVNALFLNIDT